jgi:hypothetical protein
MDVAYSIFHCKNNKVYHGAEASTSRPAGTEEQGTHLPLSSKIKQVLKNKNISSPLIQGSRSRRRLSMAKNAHGQADKILVRPFFFKYFIYLSIVHFYKYFTFGVFF